MFRLATFAVVVATSFSISALSTVWGQLPQFDAQGNVDVDAMRRQVMSGIPLGPGPVDPCSMWGVQLMPVPKLFANCHPALASGVGLLVVDVLPGSPADQTGITPGTVILAIDSLELKEIVDVLPVQQATEITLLTEDGVETRKVRRAANRSYSNAKTSSSNQSSGESVSVTNVNGLVHIRARLMTSTGPTDIDMKGTRVEIDQQIEALPPDLATQLRSRVSY